nr:XdhC family protein [uncultured Holophaga sp.]
MTSSDTQALTSLRAALQRTLDALEAGIRPQASSGDFPCFEPANLEGDPWVSPASLDTVMEALGPADIPTLQEALRAMDADEQAWLGFKLVTDPLLATAPDASADALPGLFVVHNPTGERKDARIISSRSPSPRDLKQMMDITSGPQMHGEEFAGVAWKSLPLFHQTRVFLFGGGLVSAEVALLAHRVGFGVVVVDEDPAFLTTSRFPSASRTAIASFDSIPDLGITRHDFVCVLTRGHAHDPQALVHAIQCGAGYIGMMGRASKNSRVLTQAREAGIPEETLARIHAPIGLDFGARTPQELAVAIVAQLIQVRRQLRSVQS